MKNEKWHKWFAWYPIKLETGEIVFLRTIYRRWVVVDLYYTSAEGYDYKSSHNKTEITGVAIKYNKDSFFVSLPKPNRHHHIIRMMINEKLEESPIVGEQGFIDQYNNFISREDAYKIAIKNGQFNRKYESNMKILFSEDLW